MTVTEHRHRLAREPFLGRIHRAIHSHRIGHCVILTHLASLCCEFGRAASGHCRLGAMSVRTSQVSCCVAGGGPAGMMLGLLLARAGVRVQVLEKHADFLRDFRGDTIHPSTLELMHELGLLEELLRLPHQELSRLVAQVGRRRAAHRRFLAPADPLQVHRHHAAVGLPRLPGAARAALPGLPARDAGRGHRAASRKAGRVTGVRGPTTPTGPLEVRADLVVAADGRPSVLRDCAGLAVEDLGAPMDVLWFRLSRAPGDPTRHDGPLRRREESSC